MTNGEKKAFNNGLITGMASKGIIKANSVSGNSATCFPHYAECLVPIGSWIHVVSGNPTQYTMQ